MAITFLRTRARLVTLIIGFSLVIMVLLSNITPAAASGGVSVERYYYSDASMTQQVGMSILSCTGGFQKSGKITSHYIEYKDPCW